MCAARSVSPHTSLPSCGRRPAQCDETWNEALYAFCRLDLPLQRTSVNISNSGGAVWRPHSGPARKDVPGPPCALEALFLVLESQITQDIVIRLVGGRRRRSAPEETDSDLPSARNAASWPSRMPIPILFWHLCRNIF